RSLLCRSRRPPISPPFPYTTPLPIFIAGGTEMMSYQQTLAAERSKAGQPARMMGAGNPALDEIHPQSHQGVCGDAIATREGISRDRKSTRLNSSHVSISYAVFCLKQK